MEHVNGAAMKTEVPITANPRRPTTTDLRRNICGISLECVTFRFFAFALYHERTQAGDLVT